MKMGRFEKRFVNSPSHSRRVAAQALARLERLPVEEGQRYLDVGCGNGAAALEVAAARRLSVTGIDVDPGQIALALASVPPQRDARFQVARAEDLPFSDDEFDFVATSKTMHHVPNWEAAFSEMARVVRPGGFLLFADFLLPEWAATAARFLFGRGGGFATLAGLNRLAARAGLAMVRASGWGPCLEAAWQKRPLRVEIEEAGTKISS